MKIMIIVNNYQYGMSQIESIRRQFSYKEEYLKESKIHKVYLEFEPSQLNIKWLEKLINHKIEVLES